MLGGGGRGDGGGGGLQCVLRGDGSAVEAPRLRGGRIPRLSPLLLFAQSPGLFYPRTSAPLCSLLLSFASLSPSPSSAHSCTAPSRLTSPPFTPVRRCSGAGRRSRARCSAQLWMRAGGALSSSPPPLGSRWKVRQGKALQIPCRPLRLQSTAEPAKGCCGKMLSLPSSIAKPRGVCVGGGRSGHGSCSGLCLHGHTSSTNCRVQTGCAALALSARPSVAPAASWARQSRPVPVRSAGSSVRGLLGSNRDGSR